MNRKKEAGPNEPADGKQTTTGETLFPIAGIGGAAGAVEPALELLRELGEAPGLAVVVVLHDAAHGEQLYELFGRYAQFPVQWVEDGAEPQRDRLYLARPSTRVTLIGQRFQVQSINGEPSAPIDAFLCSLAENAGERAAAVILSGAGTDGVRGVRAVRNEGGLALAQDDSAAFPQMPHAAVLSGGADTVLSPRKIARELLRMTTDIAPLRRLPEREMHAVFALLHRAHDIDFTFYKPATIERRVRRRMSVQRMSDLGHYLAFLRESPDELRQLYNEILIRVTSFFRDPDVFETLRTEILPPLLRGRANDDPIRVWVPGCATGEEVYSLAMLLIETATEHGLDTPFQIFGTDVSEIALERARVGLYGEGIVEEVSPERLRRFFVHGEGGFRIAKAVRDSCVFARQNVAKDPPFSRLDLISCRNVMIYLGPVLQRKVMALFQYGLRPSGYLLLGSSETIANYGELFTTVDRKHKIYQKRSGAARLMVDLMPEPHREPVEKTRMTEETPHTAANVFREADRIVLSRFAPPGVLIDEKLDVLQFRGRTSSFLEPPAGAASFNVLKMAREGLLTDLRAGLEEARRRETIVRREKVRVRTNGGFSLVDLEILPFLTPNKERYHLILFHEHPAEETPARGRKKKKAAEGEEPGHLDRLKQELEGTREYLQSIIEEQEAMNEELRSANEEIQSANEELQSTNEELETAKEELQSSNEELTTLNEELENRNEELAQANNDLTNLLASVELPIVMLDSQQRIRRFNPGAQRIFNLINGDVGRPMREIKTAFDLVPLDELVTQVIDRLEMHELEVQDRQGVTYLLRIRPYKTTDNRIEGAVLVLIDIDQYRKTNG